MFLPISGAKRHEFPMSGSPFGPGTSEYGRICAFFMDSFSVTISDVAGTSFGKMLIADENAVRFTSELVAVRVPILNGLSLSRSRSIPRKWRERKKNKEKKKKLFKMFLYQVRLVLGVMTKTYAVLKIDHLKYVWK